MPHAPTFNPGFDHLLNNTIAYCTMGNSHKSKPPKYGDSRDSRRPEGGTATQHRTQDTYPTQGAVQSSTTNNQYAYAPGSLTSRESSSSYFTTHTQSQFRALINSRAPRTGPAHQLAWAQSYQEARLNGAGVEIALNYADMDLSHRVNPLIADDYQETEEGQQDCYLSRVQDACAALNRTNGVQNTEVWGTDRMVAVGAVQYDADTEDLEDGDVPLTETIGDRPLHDHLRHVSY